MVCPKYKHETCVGANSGQYVPSINILPALLEFTFCMEKEMNEITTQIIVKTLIVINAVKERSMVL